MSSFDDSIRHACQNSAPPVPNVSQDVIRHIRESEFDLTQQRKKTEIFVYGLMRPTLLTSALALCLLAGLIGGALFKHRDEKVFLARNSLHVDVFTPSPPLFGSNR
ncbi:MAG: hypothetical protein SGI71_00650 [Verrucomicrobiota bacterium]|nr:hypothetical protein [Verrucomicrobiota bacterium]